MISTGLRTDPPKKILFSASSQLEIEPLIILIMMIKPDIYLPSSTFHLDYFPWFINENVINYNVENLDIPQVYHINCFSPIFKAFHLVVKENYVGQA